MEWEAGRWIAGKYRVERVIGRGGVGVVVAAHHAALGQRVALKFLRSELSSEPQLVQRFLREAQAAAQIRSEHVARVMDATMLEDGTAFLVMEYLEGRDLAEVLSKEGPLPIEAACDYVLQACDAIGEAHARGMVHRDVKPSNLFLAKTIEGAPLVKVLDFGLTKLREIDVGLALTADNHIIGTPHFMSPEQIQSARNVDERSDIWSLGVTLYALLTAKVPFDGPSFPAICVAVMTSAPPAMAGFRAEVPPELERVVARCLARDPNERFASVAELAAALAPFASTENRRIARRIARVLGAAEPLPTPAVEPNLAAPTLATPLLPSLADRTVSGAGAWAKGSEPLAPPRPSIPPSPPRRRSRRAWTAVVGGMALAFAIGIVAGGRRPPDAAPSAPASLAEEALPPPLSPAPTPEAPKAPRPTPEPPSPEAAAVRPPSAGGSAGSAPRGAAREPRTPKPPLTKAAASQARPPCPLATGSADPRRGQAARDEALIQHWPH